MAIKKGKDGKYRVGRKIVVQTAFGPWMYLKTGRLFVIADVKDVKKWVGSINNNS